VLLAGEVPVPHATGADEMPGGRPGPLAEEKVRGGERGAADCIANHALDVVEARASHG
jgi:hypothetical protein